jgi:hypothetical protein
MPNSGHCPRRTISGHGAISRSERNAASATELRSATDQCCCWTFADNGGLREVRHNQPVNRCYPLKSDLTPPLAPLPPSPVLPLTPRATAPIGSQSCDDYLAYLVYRVCSSAAAARTRHAARHEWACKTTGRAGGAWRDGGGHDEVSIRGCQMEPRPTSESPCGLPARREPSQHQGPSCRPNPGPNCGLRLAPRCAVSQPGRRCCHGSAGALRGAWRRCMHLQPSCITLQPNSTSPCLGSTHTPQQSEIAHGADYSRTRPAPDPT